MFFYFLLFAFVSYGIVLLKQCLEQSVLLKQLKQSIASDHSEDHLEKFLPIIAFCYRSVLRMKSQLKISGNLTNNR